MAKVQQFSGIDTSKNSFDVAFEESSKYKMMQFPYTEERMEACLTFLPKGTHCIIESTGTYHCRLAYFLFEHGVKLSVVNPFSVK